MENKRKDDMGGKQSDDKTGQHAPGRQNEYDRESRPGHSGQYERNRPDQEQGGREGGGRRENQRTE